MAPITGQYMPQNTFYVGKTDLFYTD